MISQFSKELSEVLAFSREEADRLSCPSVAPEHLLLAVFRLSDPKIQRVISTLSLDVPTVKKELEQYASSNKEESKRIYEEINVTDRAANVLHLAVLEARIQHRKIVDVEDLILAILHDQTDTGAKMTLQAHHLDYIEANALLRQLANDVQGGLDLSDDDDDDMLFNDDEEEDREEARSQGGGAQQTRTKETKSATPALDNFGTDLTAAAQEGKLDPVVGREREIIRVSEILGRRKKNNPVLIGEPGVGKSAIVEGLAQMIVQHRTSPTLFNKRIVSLDMTSIVAGTKYRGQFEERIRTILKEIERHSEVIVFIDEIHTIIGAGSAAGTMDAANILKPALARGMMQCIGATTLDEYRKSIEKDGALERRFQKVIVEPTTTEETLQILKNIKDRYEHHHQVTYSDEVLQLIVKLTDRYVSDRFFPDKAIDVLDEVGSHIHLQHAEVPKEIVDLQNEIEEIKQKKQNAVKNQNFEMAAGFRDQQVEREKQLEEAQHRWEEGEVGEQVAITEDQVADVVSMMTGVPVQRMQQSEGLRLRNMATELKQVVVAQDKAIEKMVKAIQRNRVGLKEQNHPIGAFMFLGPTGVGKTYLAKKLAEYMFGSADALIRVDMSEYTESFNTSRLVGAPPGYVGYDEGGQLTERVRRHPYSIVLLDEIEKAHGNVFNLLLQVLDEGRLTDGNGRLIDFRNTVIIMTSNAGTRQLKEFGRGIGFTAGGAEGFARNEKNKEYARSIIQKSLSKQFSPEFLNRLDEIITFDQLDLNAIKQIVEIELKGLYKRVGELGYALQLSDAAKEFVAKKGYDVQFGARPLKRAIQNYVEDGLSERILSGEMKEGDSILVNLTEDGSNLSFDTQVPDHELF